MYAFSQLNGVKIYNLSHSHLQSNQTTQKISLIQAFQFPVAPTQISITNNTQYIIATGVYPPTIKIFDLSQLTLKCSRGIDSQVKTFKILSDDYSKIAFGCADRMIEFHARYGFHYKTRIPNIPTDMDVNSPLLYISCIGNEIFRMDLQQGKFIQPYKGYSSRIHKMLYKQQLNLIYAVGEEFLEIWDEREKRGKPRHQGGYSIASDNMQYAIGMAQYIKIYDIRSIHPLYTLDQHYDLPIRNIKYTHNHKLLAASQKSLKIYNLPQCDLFTNIQPKYQINDLEFVNKSGLIIVGLETSQIGLFFVPQLGPAPDWCPYLQNITQQLEQQINNTIYQEFKFLNTNDLEDLNCRNLIGSNLLKRHLDGYLMHIKLYNKLKTQQTSFHYQNYRKSLIESGIKKMAMPKTNQQDQHINDQTEGDKKQYDINKDKRLQKLVKDDRFAINKKSTQYLLSHPNERKQIMKQIQIDQRQRKKLVQRVNKKIKK